MQTKQINLKLVGLDGNAFSIMGAFRHQANKEGWSKQEINSVLDDAMSKDYSNLVSTIATYCHNPLGDDDEENYFEDDSIYDEDEDEGGLRTWRGEKSNI